MNRLIRLYPRAWRDRYGEEFAALVNEVSGGRRRLRLTLDIARGALDAHLRGRFAMRRNLVGAAVRRGVRDGLLIAGLLAVFVVATNVVFPGGPNESDADPEYLIQYAATLAVLAALLIAIGARGRRRSTEMLGGAKAGAAAGAVIAVMLTLIFLTVNNLFLDIVSRQHDKRLAFAASGWSSMRAYLTVTQLQGALVLVPVLTVFGAALGLLGAAVFKPRAERASSGL
jgi:uncharacterized membrane protein YozB (DUF420 family)